MINRKIAIIAIVALIVIITTSSIVLWNKKQPVETMSYNDFVESVESKQVNSVQIKNQEILEVTLKDKNVVQVPNPLKADFKEFLLIHDIEVLNESSVDIVNVLSILLVISIFLGVTFNMRKGGFTNKQLIQDLKKNKVDSSKVITFNHVAGNYEAKEMVKDIIDFIRDPEKYEKTGAKMPKGILLYGVPGTGKTLLAKAIAGEANVPFYALSGSDFVQMYVGVGASRVRQLFKKAKHSKKAVIFIDEIDALGKSRGNQTSSANDEREQTLNALLTEMSGFHDSDGIVVIGATNRMDTLDPALLRPGRFDRQIEVSLPDQEARKEIIQLYLENKPVNEQVNVDEIAVKTVMFSGAMLENLMNEAAIIAANKGEKIIKKEHIDQAYFHVIAGMDKKGKASIDQEEKQITAYHEAGHALVAKLLLPKLNVVKVTIIPTTKGAAGYNLNIPQDSMYKKKYELLANIKILLAGRATEEIIFGAENVTTGASNDIQEASKELYHYFKTYGMDEENGLFNLQIHNAIDEQIYEQCKERMKELYEETRSLIQKNQRSLKSIVKELLLKETLTGKELDLILTTIQQIA